MSICEFEGCGRSGYNRLALCKSHYEQQRRGRALAPLQPLSGTVPLEERFWSQVTRGDGCWEWTGSKRGRNYGGTRAFGRNMYAHVVAYVLTHGPLPEGFMLDHICRNPPCVRPSHLRTVTSKQNQENRNGTFRNPLPRGVSLLKKTGKYRARVIHNRTCHYAGQFDTAEEAAEAAIAKRNELYTHNNTDRRAA